MADITITDANLIPSAGATIIAVKWGATITRGDAVYKNSSQLWVKAQANGAGTYKAQGIAMSDGANGQPGSVLTRDPALALGATVAEGTFLAVSADNAGGIVDVSELTSGDFPYVFGIVKENNVADVDFSRVLTTGRALPA